MDPSTSPTVPEGEAPVRWGLGDFIGIYLFGLVASLVGLSVGLAITGDQSGHIGALTTALAAGGQFGGWFAALVFVSRTKGRGSLGLDFGFTLQIRDWWALFAGLGLFFVGSVMILPLVDTVNEHQQVVNDLENATGAKLVVFALLAGIVAPVCEELLFRGLLLRSLRRRMAPWAAIAVQALIFAFSHPLLSPTLGDLAVVPALLLLGVMSGIAATRRGDLSASILMHIGFNLVTTLTAL